MLDIPRFFCDNNENIYTVDSAGYVSLVWWRRHKEGLWSPIDNLPAHAVEVELAVTHEDHQDVHRTAREAQRYNAEREHLMTGVLDTWGAVHAERPAEILGRGPTQRIAIARARRSGAVYLTAVLLPVPLGLMREK